MIYELALVTDRPGSFATVLSKPIPRLVEGGRIVVTTLGLFGHEREALAFLREVRRVDVHERERKPWNREAVERHAGRGVHTHH